MLNKKTVFETDWFTVESEDFDLPQLHGKPIYRINTPDSVTVIAFTEDKKLILVKQFRAASGIFTIELPSGSVDVNETREIAAARELYEETGYHCQKLEYVSQGRVMADRVNSNIFVFFGRNAIKDINFVSEEGIEVVLVSFTELKDIVHRGELKQLAGLGTLVLAKWILNPLELQEL